MRSLTKSKVKSFLTKSRNRKLKNKLKKKLSECKLSLKKKRRDWLRRRKKGE